MNLPVFYDKEFTSLEQAATERIILLEIPDSIRIWDRLHDIFIVDSLIRARGKCVNELLLAS